MKTYLFLYFKVPDCRILNQGLTNWDIKLFQLGHFLNLKPVQLKPDYKLVS